MDAACSDHSSRGEHRDSTDGTSKKQNQSSSSEILRPERLRDETRKKALRRVQKPWRHG